MVLTTHSSEMLLEDFFMLLLESKEVERCRRGDGSLNAKSRAKGRAEAISYEMKKTLHFRERWKVKRHLVIIVHTFIILGIILEQ